MGMSYEEQLNAALNILHEWTLRLFDCAGRTIQEAETFWNELQAAPEILKEYAYYYDNREFLCQYNVNGYTIADMLVWQMDHFKLHMDRADSANRYDKDRLMLSAFQAMLDLRNNPVRISREFASETGTDLSEGWNLH
ncbi:MAG: hypothetical protein ACI39Q_09340 [Wujia sp.]